MNQFQRMVAISNKEYADLVAAAQEATTLKRYLDRKLNCFAGIKHSELADICAMFGIEIEEV